MNDGTRRVAQVKTAFAMSANTLEWRSGKCPYRCCFTLSSDGATLSFDSAFTMKTEGLVFVFTCPHGYELILICGGQSHDQRR